eukprot:comp5986_c0_seq1/m.1831 comp5986_c0_seq1/g.1831  ORF comp5986_c0_seq1/g.1831 comp5986_c0_seq1/m.1831 type:complete len:539 (-) comp5986_c0_seq1:82-1698(-)
MASSRGQEPHIHHEDDGKPFFVDKRRRSTFSEPPVNPFSYPTPPQRSFAFKAQTVLFGVTLLPIRLFASVSLVVTAFVAANIALFGVKKGLNAPRLTGWRLALIHTIRPLARCLLFFAGFHRIKTKGKLATAKEAPVLVIAPHSSLVDVLYIVACSLPSPVSRLENAYIPLIGNIISALQPIYVDRKDPDSKKSCLNEIRKRATSGGEWPQIMIFPEGTTTNRQALIQFKTGAFTPGVPVQPIIIRYKCAIDPAWVLGGPSGITSGLLMMCQWNNTMEIEFMSVYKPDEQEKKDPALFAANVRHVMSNALDVPVTEHAFEDISLMYAAAKKKMPYNVGAIEVPKITKALQLKKERVEDLLDSFAHMDTDSDGYVTIEEFAKHLSVPVDKNLRNLFAVYDRNGDGKINFREFLIGRCLVSDPVNTPETLKYAFEIMDEAKTGEVTSTQFQTILQWANPQLTPEQCQEIFRRAVPPDHTNLTFQDFSNVVAENPEYMKLILSVKADREAQLMDLATKADAMTPDNPVGAMVAGEKEKKSD